ncbi:MAG: hypothetical protein U5K69_29810 [Balneolaceae bacterium]|nr:hypothetical protein [Balneolaceae bacterium]
MKKQNHISPKKTRNRNTHSTYHRTVSYFSILILSFVFMGADYSMLPKPNHENGIIAEASAIHDRDSDQHKFITVADDISGTLDPEYNIERICVGNGIFAAVVKYDSQYYVFTSKSPLKSSYRIISLQGLKFSGQRYMEYVGDSRNKTTRVRVLSRFQYKYSGFEGARSVCRQVTQR